MADSIFQLKWYCSTGVCPRGAQVRQRCGRSLGPLSSRKTIVRPSFLAFFLTPANVSASTSGSSLHPAPAPASGTLTAPSQLPQDAPSLRGMIADPAFLLDQLRHPPRRPQTG